MFKSYAERINFKPKDGMKVIVFGGVSVFERDGVYQIYVKTMMEDGMGDLHEQFEQLKAKLEKEGKAFVFAPSKHLNLGTFSKDAALEQKLYDLGVFDYKTQSGKLLAFLQK